VAKPVPPVLPKTMIFMPGFLTPKQSGENRGQNRVNQV
jgi:hypothetical protein